MDELIIIRFIQDKLRSYNIIDKTFKYSSYILYFPQNVLFIGFIFYLLRFNMYFTYAFLAYYEMIIYLIKNLIKRKRPYIKNPDKVLILDKNKPKSYSFPSAHATSSYLISYLLYLLYPMKILFIFPFIIGLSRVYLGVHYPSDIFFGFLFGYLFQLQLIYFNLIKYFFL